MYYADPPPPPHQVLGLPKIFFIIIYSILPSKEVKSAHDSTLRVNQSAVHWSSALEFL